MEISAARDGLRVERPIEDGMWGARARVMLCAWPITTVSSASAISIVRVVQMRCTL